MLFYYLQFTSKKKTNTTGIQNILLTSTLMNKALFQQYPGYRPAINRVSLLRLNHPEQVRALSLPGYHMQ